MKSGSTLLLALWRSGLSRYAHNVKIVGSNPTSATKFYERFNIMVWYVGGKTRIFPKFKHFIEEKLTTENRYIEPFVGGGSCVTNINHHTRLAYDIHPKLIALLKALQDGWIPPYVDEDLYKEIKDNPNNYEDCLVGFAMFSCSFGGKEFGGYARGNDDKVASQIKSCLKKAPKLKNVILNCQSYNTIEIEDNDVVYCDPPYKGTLGYGKLNFDFDEFDSWARETSKRAHVFISEMTPIKTFDIIWEKPRKINVSLQTKKIKTELLMYKGPKE